MNEARNDQVSLGHFEHADIELFAFPCKVVHRKKIASIELHFSAKEYHSRLSPYP